MFVLFPGECCDALSEADAEAASAYETDFGCLLESFQDCCSLLDLLF